MGFSPVAIFHRIEKLEEYVKTVPLFTSALIIYQDKDENELKNLPKSILKIANPCRNNNINKIFVSSILLSLRTSIEIEKR